MTSLSFDLLWRDRGVAKGMKDLGAQTDKTRASLSKLNQAAGKGLSGGLGALGGTVAKFGKAGALAFGVASAAASVFGVKVASGNEQAKISFTTMLGSAKRADKFLRQLQQFAAKTPFEFPELQTAASSLISVGIKADKIIPIMTSLGNATAGMGTGAEGVKRATVALQQMTAAGRITAEDLNQLRDAGIPVFDLLTKATGKTTAEIAKMAANGKLGKKELTQLMAALESGKGLERFAGLMDKQSHSLAGLWSTFRDTAGQMLAGLATSAFPLMKSGLAAVSTELGHLGAWVKDNRDSLGSVFKVLGSTLTTLGGVVKTVFKSFAQSAGLGKGSFKDFADFLATHQEDITRGIITGGKAFIAFGTIIAHVVSGGMRLFGGFADFIGESTSFIIDRWAEMSTGFALIFGQGPLGKGVRDADARFQAFADHARTNTHKVGDAARGMADGIDKNVIPALDKMGHGLDTFGKKSITAAHARDAAAKAEIGFRHAAADAMATVKAYGKGLDTNTAAGTKNRAALNNLVISSQNYISKLIQAHASSKKVTAATADARAEFVRVAVKMGVSRDRAKDLATAYFKIPKGVKTNVTQPGMHGKNGALESAAELKTRINNIKSKTVKLSMQFQANATKAAVNFFKTVPGSQASGFVNSFRAQGGVLPGFTPGRDVHDFYSPTGGQLHLSGGEAVMRPEWTKAVGGPKAVAQMNAEAKSGKLSTGFAQGGVVTRSLKMNVKTGKIPSSVGYWVPAGVAAGSALGSDATRELGADARKALDAAIAAGMGGGGGPIGSGGYASALRYARAHRGHPYIFGSLWDCSGFMSALHSIILGQRPHRRYTTTAFHGAHAAGFTRGKSSPFRVGVRPLSGKFGHMAGTLNGVNVESAGGVGVRVGGRARGAGSGMFSWRGGLAKGGVIGDLPFDLLDPQGERYNPWLADLVHKAGYRKGGRIGANGGPERVLSAPQNRAFEHLVRVMDRRSGGAGNTTIILNAPNYIGSRSELKQTLVTMARSGDFNVVLARAGVR